MIGLRLALYSFIFLAVFNFTSPLMASIYIVGELGGSSDIISYSVSFFGIGNAASFPLAHIFGDRLGKTNTLLFFSLLFLITLFLCPLMPTFFLFVLARFFNGFTCGVFFPLGVSLLQKVNTEPQAKRFMAYLAFLVSITPVLGAATGGVIAYLYEWSWVFYLQVPLVLFCIASLYYNKKRFEEPIKKSPYDIVGYILYFLTIGSWTSFIVLGQELDWLRSPFLIFLLILAIASLPIFLLWEWKHPSPIIDLQLLKIRNFAISTFAVFMLFSAYFGMVILLTVWLHFDVNYTPTWISVLLLHMLIASVFLFFFVLKWIKKTAPFLPVLIAVLAFTISCFYSANFNAEINFLRISISRILAGFGLAFFFFPLFTICMNSLPQNKMAQGIALFQSSRLIAGSIGVSFYHTLFIRRIVFYYTRLDSELTPTNPNVQQFFQNLSYFHPKGLQKPAFLESALHTQATALGLADCFYAMAWLMAGLFILLLPFLFKKKENQISSPSPEG